MTPTDRGRAITLLAAQGAADDETIAGVREDLKADAEAVAIVNLIRAAEKARFRDGTTDES